MNDRYRNSIFLSLVLSLALTACSSQGLSSQVAMTRTPMPTPRPVPVESIMNWKVGSKATQTIYDQAQRSAVGAGDPYFFWPDGNLSFIAAGDQYRFFGPNGARTARTIGTFDDPGAQLEAVRMTIRDVDPQFPFASGGPVYLDPDTGMLLMFYHAEDHFGGNGSIFHAFIGLAVSNDVGKSFQSLGIILSTNAPPNAEAPCCADIGGAAYTIKDEKFYLYFRDRLVNLDDIQLAVASAPVAEVLEAARNGKTSPWFKYYNGAQEPGLAGRSSPLEEGNPLTNWFSVSYNTYIKKFIMAVSSHSWTDAYDSSLYLITSDDGYSWSPRLSLERAPHSELTYPTIISPDGDPLKTNEKFYIYYVTTSRGATRWADTALQRMTVTLTGEMVEIPHAWEFDKDTDREGWESANQIGIFGVNSGAMIIEATGYDPFLYSPELGFSSSTYGKIEIRMKAGAAGTGQFFFTTIDAPEISESSSVRFPVEVSEDFETYTVDMSKATGWSGRIKSLRLDPIDQVTRVEIDYIRLLP